MTDTITIPAGARIVGEVWSVIMGSGSAFSDVSSPKQVVKVGNAGDTGDVEISDIIFATKAPGQSCPLRKFTKTHRRSTP